MGEKARNNWTHQTELKKSLGKRIVLVFLDGTHDTSVLIDADNYTLKTTTGIVFKHAIRGYVIDNSQ